MAKISFTSALKQFFPDLQEMQLDGNSVSEVLQKLNSLHPGIIEYLLEEDGQLRKHVNIYLGDELVLDRVHLSDQVNREDEILIFQALSGG